MDQITDGTSNTIMLVEAKRDIPWTKPEDIPYDPNKPVPKLGGGFEMDFFIALADGSVHFSPAQQTKRHSACLSLRADGQPVQMDKVLARTASTRNSADGTAADAGPAKKNRG